mmetsp:Transcript_1044/g.1628  ORF Transcript_1044/g.1628 Transcript_1044/m.1628 type:complete len:269 (-) Transcript_1044:47-853(-)|eukprot:CAMPEP_0117425318 /NCGR_PEP_ID=MMETSP0758-20121206/5600_1 /TAXON_ID=63605 /ORGANISM="Percolomonas cosmopolitus, Strain AE-1 (ATCC 50343)" /LENGTH=268 /DNA_ID=CAMNT_0005209703 /DNA_START=147 /DNA_END=953 /DNA_ORIENTATION=+
MPQNNYIEEYQKEHGKGQGVLQMWEKKRKREARISKHQSKMARKLTGIKAKLHNKERFREKVQMKKTIKEYEEKLKKNKPNQPRDDEDVPEGALPAYLLDREEVNRSKILSNTIKQKRKEKAGKWAVPVPTVKALTEDEMFRIMRSGKRKRNVYKRMINKMSFVGNDFTRKPPKYERFIRPMGLRVKKANVTHPELKTTFQLPILKVQKNPQSRVYTSLAVITKGTIIEVNVSDLGLVTPSGKVVYGKYAQVTNNPEMDGCVNAVLLV